MGRRVGGRGRPTPGAREAAGLELTYQGTSPACRAQGFGEVSWVGGQKKEQSDAVRVGRLLQLLGARG